MSLSLSVARETSCLLAQGLMSAGAQDLEPRVVAISAVDACVKKQPLGHAGLVPSFTRLFSLFVGIC